MEILERPAADTNVWNIEIIWVRIRVKYVCILFASAYRHPTNNFSQLPADFDDLESKLQFMIASDPGAAEIIAGDLNACLLSTSGGASTPGYKLRQL